MIDIYAPYIREGKDNALIDKKSTSIIERVKISDFDKAVNLSKDKFYLITFEIGNKYLDIESGQKIVRILEELKNSGVKFRVSRPIFPCMLGSSWKSTLRKYEIPSGCGDCPELFSVGEDGMTRGCFVLKNKLGPKFEYMRDRNQLFEYFHTFLEKLSVDEKCKNCVYFFRKECEGMCLRR